MIVLRHISHLWMGNGNHWGHILPGSTWAGPYYAMVSRPLEPNEPDSKVPYIQEFDEVSESLVTELLWVWKSLVIPSLFPLYMCLVCLAPRLPHPKTMYFNDNLKQHWIEIWRRISNTRREHNQCLRNCWAATYLFIITIISFVQILW